MTKDKPTMFESLFPGWAYKRAVARHNCRVVENYDGPNQKWRQPGYSGGHPGRARKPMNGGSGAEDKVANWSRDELIENCLQLYRNDPMTKSIINASADYLGESHPHAVTSSAEWNKRANDYFIDQFWTFADARRRPGVDYGEFQRQFDTNSWLMGDMMLLPFEASLLPCEGVQIGTPRQLRHDDRITNGVRVQKMAPYRISHYYVIEASERFGKDKFSRVRANQCFFAGARNWRSAMLRSVPDLHGVVDALHSFGKTNDNVQKRVEFESMLWTIEGKGKINSGAGARMLDRGTSGDMKTESTRVDYGMRLKVNGDVDKDFKLAQMQNPQSNYTQVMEFMGRVLSAGTGFPYEIVMHIYTNGSYTSNRMARLDFAKAILKRWAWRNKVFNQRIWNWAIAKAIKSGRLEPAPVDPVTGLSEWHKCAWTLPHFPHVDEGKEVIADISQWGCGQESMEEWARQKGMSRDQLLEAHDEDIRACQQRAEALGVPLSVYMGKLFTDTAVQTMHEQDAKE